MIANNPINQRQSEAAMAVPLVVKNGSKIRGNTSVSIPQPLSVISTQT